MGILNWATGGSTKRTRRFSLAGSWLPAGAVMTGLVLLGGAVPASAQTLAWSVVSCVSPDTCTAAGEACHSNTQTTSLIESWDGNSWSVVPTPNPGIIDHVLNGVSCASQNFCMAAGWFFSNPTYRTLTLVGTAAG